MRRLLTTLSLILLVLLLVGAGGYFFLRQSLPQTSGTIQLPGLDGTIDIVRDSDSVPHIFAKSDHDAYFALGYVHAQDRMWQLEMNRRIGNGRMSELFGERTLAIDKFQRTLGYARVVRKSYEVLEEKSKLALNAYAEGVNAWIGEGHLLPPEFLILQTKPEPWTVYDSLVWAKMMAWDLAGDYDLELLRAKLVAALGSERAAQILPDYPKDAPTVLAELMPSNSNSARHSTANEQSLNPSTLFRTNLSISNFSAGNLLALSTQLETAFTHGGQEVGSNDWVIGGERTESGKPILADDPHLGASIPSVWYLAEFQGESFHSMGATFPGLPTIVIGHNERIAWGVTNLNPDVQDLFAEKINPANPNQYEVNGEWKSMEVSEELIKVSGKDEPIRWAARWTRHGPLISDVSDSSTPVSMRWTALDDDDTTIDAFININAAGNWEEFRQAMHRFIGPSQNFVFADVDGNIGYIGPGRIPIRKTGNGYLPAPGWNDDYAWTGWIPFDDLPQTYNPQAGFVATANNKVVPDDYPYFISSDWAEPYRAERIVELIQEMSQGSAKISLDDVAAIHGDQASSEVQEALPLLLNMLASGAPSEPASDPAKETRRENALTYLRSWDRVSSLGSVAATLYEAWIVHLTRALFEDDLRGDLYTEMANRSNPIFLLHVLDDPTGSVVWCDNVLTANPESCADTLQIALDRALDDLGARLGNDMSQWQWEKVHITQYPHRPFSDVPVLKWFFHRSIANGGNRYTVNVAPIRLTDAYNQFHVPSYRQIVDMSDLNNSRFILTTGQSGNPLSPHYSDFVERHRDVRYLPMRFGRENVNGETLQLVPVVSSQ